MSARSATRLMHATPWPLDKIVPYPRNPRVHPKKQIELLARLMKKYGIDQPIVVDEKGVILKGHGRRLAAIEAGLSEFPVIVRKGLSKSDKQAIRIADNQVSVLSGWDDELLKIEIKELQENGFDMPMVGFSETKFDKLLGASEESSTARLEGLKFSVIVDCESEDDQRERLKQLAGMGMRCRALIS